MPRPLITSGTDWRFGADADFFCLFCRSLILYKMHINVSRRSVSGVIGTLHVEVCLISSGFSGWGGSGGGGGGSSRGETSFNPADPCRDRFD